MKFSDIVDERGFLKKGAKEFVNERLIKELNTLLRYAKSENELRILGSILKNVVGDVVSSRIQENKNR